MGSALMPNIYTAFRTNFLTHLKADATLTALLADGASGIFAIWPGKVANRPALSYFVTGRTPEQMAVSPGAGAWSFRPSLTMHGRDMDALDAIDAAIDGLLNNDDKLGNTGLSSSDINVTGFHEISVQSEFDPMLFAQETVEEIRTRNFECFITDPTSPQA
jgi:hypothetical protein